MPSSFYQRRKLRKRLIFQTDNSAVMPLFMNGKGRGPVIDTVIPGDLRRIGTDPKGITALTEKGDPRRPVCRQRLFHILPVYTAPMKVRSLFIISSVHEDMSMTLSEHPSPLPFQAVILYRRSGHRHRPARGRYTHFRSTPDPGVRSRSPHRGVPYEDAPGPPVQR